MNFYNFIIISISLLLFLKLPRILIFENLKFLYYPIVEVSNFISDIYSIRENFEKLILLEDNRTINGFAISFIPSIFPREIIINVGSNDGVKYGDILTIKNILIGKIVEVNRGSSRAITIYNEKFSASTIIKRSKYLGIFEGGKVPKISYIAQGSDIKEGDTVITSSLDGVYPYGLFLGVVGRVIERRGVFESREVIVPYKFERLVRFNVLKL